MQTLTDEISSAEGEAQVQLDAIREHTARAMKGVRRSVIDIVLVELADVDGSMMMGPSERRKLLTLIAHMAGRLTSEVMPRTVNGSSVRCPYPLLRAPSALRSRADAGSVSHARQPRCSMRYPYPHAPSTFSTALDVLT